MKKTAILLIVTLLCGAAPPARALGAEEATARDIAAVMREQRDTAFRIAVPGDVGQNPWVNYLFEKSHPGVRVEYVPYEPLAFETELMADPARFDMIVTNSPETLHAHGLCVDGYGVLGGWPERLLDMRLLCEAEDGALMGLPVFLSLEGLYFNAALGREYGIEAPGEGYTWEDLVPLCERVARLRAGGANIYLMAGPKSPDSVMDGFLAMLDQYLSYRAGKAPFRVDGEELAALLDVWKTLRESEAVKPFVEGSGLAFYENILLQNAAFDPQVIQLGLLPMPGLYREAPAHTYAAYLLCGSTASRQPGLVRDYLALYVSEEGQRYAGEALSLSQQMPEKRLWVLQGGAQPEVRLEDYLALVDEGGLPVDPPYSGEQVARAQAMRRQFLEGASRLAVPKDLYRAWVSGLARYQSGKLTAKDMAAELNDKLSLMMGD